MFFHYQENQHIIFYGIVWNALWLIIPRKHISLII